MLFGGVVKVPYINWALTSPYLPSIRLEVDSERIKTKVHYNVTKILLLNFYIIDSVLQ